MVSKVFLAVLLSGLLFFSGCLDVGGRKPNPDLCNQVSSPAGRSDCFHRVAVAIGNAELCKKITDVSIKDQCFADLAEGNTWVARPGID